MLSSLYFLGACLSIEVRVDPSATNLEVRALFPFSLSSFLLIQVWESQQGGLEVNHRQSKTAVKKKKPLPGVSSSWRSSSARSSISFGPPFWSRFVFFFWSSLWWEEEEKSTEADSKKDLSVFSLSISGPSSHLLHLFYVDLLPLSHEASSAFAMLSPITV